MSYQGEFALENEVIKQLESQGYERVILRDHDQLVNNFRQILNERNMDKLNNKPLTDTEFARLMTDMSDKVSLKVRCNYMIATHLKEMTNQRCTYIS